MKLIGIGRKDIADLVHQRLNFSRTHITGILAILLEEMVNDLKAGLEIRVGGFGTFFLKQMKDRKHINKMTQLLVTSAGKRSLRFYLDKDFSDFIVNSLDWQRTFPLDTFDEDAYN